MASAIRPARKALSPSKNDFKAGTEWVVIAMRASCSSGRLERSASHVVALMKTETIPNLGSDDSPAAMGLAVFAIWVLAALQCAMFVGGGGTGYRIVGSLVFVATSAF